MSQIRLILSLALLLAWVGGLSAQSLSGFAGLKGVKLDQREMAKVEGGDTYVNLNLDEKSFAAITVPMDANGRVDYSSITTTSGAAGSNPVPYLVYDAYNNDYYAPKQFPKGEWEGKVVHITDPEKAKKYGDADGNWLMTDAHTDVDSYQKQNDGTFIPSDPPQRPDYGYALHANENFKGPKAKDAPSYGCEVANQQNTTRVNRAITADKHGTIKVIVR